MVPEEEESASACITKANTLVAFSTGEGSEAIGPYDWHRRICHRCMKTMIDMTNGAVTELVLKDVPEDVPKFDSCPSCALTKAQRLPFKLGARALEPLEPVHGDLVGPIPVESTSCCKYGFIPVDDDSRCELGTAPESET